MGGYEQYCPVARAIEIIGDRWTPLIIRELLAGIHRFNDLDRGLPGISRPLLTERLRRLEHAGIVERRIGAGGRMVGYYLTNAGQGLKGVIDTLGTWGARWVFGDPRTEELDAAFLIWRMRRRINLELVPRERVVIRFAFSGVKRQRPLWLVVEKPEASVCLTDPGFETDLFVTADLAALHKVWLGRSTWDEALRQGLVEIEGPSVLARALPCWLKWSPFADAVREAMGHPGPRQLEKMRP